MRILLFSQSTEGTGNYTTAQRIMQCLEGDLHENEVHFADSAEITRFSEHKEHIKNFDLLIVIHALHFSRFLLPCCQIPYIVILGGTDVNVSLAEPTKRLIIRQILLQSQSIIAFTEALQSKLLYELKDDSLVLSSKLTLIPQSVTLEDEDTSIAPSWREILGLSPHDFLILLPASIRAIKDPAFFVSPFQCWFRQRQRTKERQKPNENFSLLFPEINIRFVLAGPILEDTYLHPSSLSPPSSSLSPPSSSLSPPSSSLSPPSLSPSSCSSDVSSLRKVIETYKQHNTPLQSHSSHSSHSSPPPPVPPHMDGVQYLGVLPRASLLSLMRDSDLVLNTSLSEGQCGAILEAMLMGKIVVARDNQGNRSLLLPPSILPPSILPPSSPSIFPSLPTSSSSSPPSSPSSPLSVLRSRTCTGFGFLFGRESENNDDEGEEGEGKEREERERQEEERREERKGKEKGKGKKKGNEKEIEEIKINNLGSGDEGDGGNEGDVLLNETQIECLEIVQAVFLEKYRNFSPSSPSLPFSSPSLGSELDSPSISPSPSPHYPSSPFLSYLSHSAQRFVQQYHSPEEEKRKYSEVLGRIEKVREERREGDP